MALETTLTSKIWNPFDGSTYADTDKIEFDYSTLGFTPSAGDSYKSTSGDVFKVYVGGVRIYRTDDSNYASGTGFLEDGDTATALNGVSATWSDTSNTVWEIDTANQLIKVDTGNILATNLYKNGGIYPSGTGNSNLTFTNSTIIEVRRSLQNENSPSVDFSNASILTEQDLDNSSLNVFHMAQQAVETANLALPYNTGTGLYEAYQPGTTTKKRITQVADGTATNDAVNKGQLSATETTTLAYKEDTEDYKLEAGDWAQKADGQVKVYTDNVRTGGDLGHSAKAHASVVGTHAPSTGSAKEWAQTVDVAIDTTFSAKEYAQGDGNSDALSTGGSAKGWAQDTAKVNGATTNDRSAKAWSQGASMTGATLGGSAKDWAQLAEDSQVNGSEYSAKHYSAKSADSATAASASEVAAKNSAAAIANSFDSFDDTYLGTMTDAVAFSADSTTEFLTSNAHGLVDTQQIQVVGSDLPSGLSASTNYFVRDKTTNTFKLAATSGGTAINLADNGSGSTWIYGDFTTPTSSTWAKNSSTITVASNVGIRVGQVVSGAGIPTSPKPNVLSIAGTSIVISENMTAASVDAGSGGAAVTFANKGVYGAFNTLKDGPSTDNDGDALEDGMLYFNSTDNNMMVYKTTGAAWIKTSSSGGVSLVMHKAVASGTPTSFAASDFTPTLSYEVNNIVVWLNGVKLDATDYTATNGTTVVLGSAAANSDELVVLAFKTFEVADAVSAASGGTFGGAVTFSAVPVFSAGVGAISGTTVTASGLITANGGIETDTNSKIKQKGSFMQSSTHQAMVLGG